MLHRYLSSYGVKKSPNIISYWTTSTLFLYCSIISSKMIRTHFELICYLHIINIVHLKTNMMNHLYDKVGKIKWLVEETKSKPRFAFNLGILITIDIMMLRYKDKYCPIRQYILNKPVK